MQAHWDTRYSKVFTYYHGLQKFSSCRSTEPTITLKVQANLARGLILSIYEKIIRLLSRLIWMIKYPKKKFKCSSSIFYAYCALNIGKIRIFVSIIPIILFAIYNKKKSKFAPILMISSLSYLYFLRFIYLIFIIISVNIFLLCSENNLDLWNHTAELKKIESF